MASKDGGSTRVLMFSVDDKALTDEQNAHIEEIGKEFCIAMADKYTAGQKEHGGNLWDLSLGKLVDCALDEAIDQVTYLLTIRRKLRLVQGSYNVNPDSPDSLRR